MLCLCKDLALVDISRYLHSLQLSRINSKKITFQETIYANLNNFMKYVRKNTTECVCKSAYINAKNAYINVGKHHRQCSLKNN